MPQLPRVLHDATAIIADHTTQSTGVAWRLDEVGRQLDANVLNLTAGQAIGTHADADLDVLLVILAGNGSMTTAADPLHLAPGQLVWLPRGSHHGLVAGIDGLAYLTVHRRRSGMQIRSSADSAPVEGRGPAG